jgi:hypothetical protein
VRTHAPPFRFLTDAWACIVTGGDIRIPPATLLLFERIVNMVIRGTPGTPLAFNASPENSTNAAERWLR